MRAVIIVVCAPSRRPLKPVRRRCNCSAVITALAARVPMTSPAIPSGLYSADADDDVDDHVHRRQARRDPWTLQREEGAGQQQVQAAEGRLKANQNSAIATRCVDWASNSRAGTQAARWGGEHEHERRRRNQQQVDLAHAGADGAAHAGRVAPRRHPAERRKQHRGHRRR